MSPWNYLRKPLRFSLAALLFSASQLSFSQSDELKFILETELGATWQSRNNVQIPNDKMGTRFALDELSGSGPRPSARVNLLWNINQKHGLRFLLAPLSYSEQSILNSDVAFAGSDFQSGQAIESSYTFNSWRASYRYHLVDQDRWDLWLGGTLNIRDAEIELRQGQTTATDDDLGVVPLLYVSTRYRLADKWHLNAEMDALAGGPGRAIDLGLRLDYTLNSRWSIGAGYRGLEGGVDSDDVYNFAWFNSFIVSAMYKF
jgi:hypothetical protein